MSTSSLPGLVGVEASTGENDISSTLKSESKIKNTNVTLLNAAYVFLFESNTISFLDKLNVHHRACIKHCL